MKRQSNLFEKICDIQNLHDACYKAARHKRYSLEYLCFREKLEEKLEKIRQDLLSKNYKLNQYRQFKISDPKERIISAAPFADRVIHHAIINVLEPIFEKQFIFHTYACRKGKGTHAAARHAFKMAKAARYFLKLDVRKYFDSVNHAVLKRQLCRIIKDSPCLELLFSVIDGYSTVEGCGLPIGNLTSQFFANLYLSPLDHFVIEKLKVKGYVRYMDDIVIFADSMNKLKSDFLEVRKFCQEYLVLFLKVPIFGKTSVGLPFLGWRITGRKVFLLHKTWKRMQCAIKRIIKDFYTLRISEEEASSRICCVYSCRRICRTHEVSCFLLLQIEPSPDWSGCVARPRKRAGAKA
ncbi:MAG: group II intron reverse transcriptase domain-containing protein [Treponema sp.]|nr:group II intron reverse transcriptase domain-containing protein [Treponema sp.]